MKENTIKSSGGYNASQALLLYKMNGCIKRVLISLDTPIYGNHYLCSQEEEELQRLEWCHALLTNALIISADIAYALTLLSLDESPS